MGSQREKEAPDSEQNEQGNKGRHRPDRVARRGGQDYGDQEQDDDESNQPVHFTTPLRVGPVARGRSPCAARPAT